MKDKDSVEMLANNAINQFLEKCKCLNVQERMHVMAVLINDCSDRIVTFSDLIVERMGDSNGK